MEIQYGQFIEWRTSEACCPPQLQKLSNEKYHTWHVSKAKNCAISWHKDNWVEQVLFHTKNCGSNYLENREQIWSEPWRYITWQTWHNAFILDAEYHNERLFMGRDGTANKMTGNGLDDRMSPPSRSGTSLFSRPDPLWDPPNLLSNVYRGTSRRGPCGRNLNLTTHLHLQPRLRMNGTFITTLPCKATEVIYI
jgi:hypothetical protein